MLKLLPNSLFLSLFKLWLAIFESDWQNSEAATFQLALWKETRFIHGICPTKLFTKYIFSTYISRARSNPYDHVLSLSGVLPYLWNTNFLLAFYTFKSRRKLMSDCNKVGRVIHEQGFCFCVACIADDVVKYCLFLDRLPLGFNVWLSPTGPFTIVELLKQNIDQFYVIKQRRSTEFKAPMLWKL